MNVQSPHHRSAFHWQAKWIEPVEETEGNFTCANFQLTPFGLQVPQEDIYILKGEGEEVYTPQFSFHGFRYVKIEGFPTAPTTRHFTGIALYSDMAEVGT